MESLKIEPILLEIENSLDSQKEPKLRAKALINALVNHYEKIKKNVVTEPNVSIMIQKGDQLIELDITIDILKFNLESCSFNSVATGDDVNVPLINEINKRLNLLVNKFKD